jgi:hypothetical protein
MTVRAFFITATLLLDSGVVEFEDGTPLLCFAIAGVNVILLGPIPSFG